MIRAIALLYCDGPCGDDEPVAHDTVTAAEARQEAKHNGWVRVKEVVGGVSKTLDLCPRCAEMRRAEGNSERVGRH